MDRTLAPLWSISVQSPFAGEVAFARTFCHWLDHHCRALPCWCTEVDPSPTLRVEPIRMSNLVYAADS